MCFSPNSRGVKPGRDVVELLPCNQYELWFVQHWAAAPLPD
jgi:hypothetical protein